MAESTEQTAATAVFAEIKDGVQAAHPHSAVAPMAAVAICQALGIDPDGPADPVAAAVAEERRACAELVREWVIAEGYFHNPATDDLVEAIRSRGEAK